MGNKWTRAARLALTRLRVAGVAAMLALSGQLAVASWNLHAVTTDVATGQVVAEQRMHNLVVDAGLNLIRDLLYDSSPAGITHFAVGTGTTAAAAAQTTLVTEVARAAITSSSNATTKTLVVTYYLPSTSANGSTLAEVGLFNASSGGSMYARAVLASTIAKTSSVAVTFTWTLTWAAA